MSVEGTDRYIRQIESQVASYDELVQALERTVAEQSERLERSHETESRLAAIVAGSDFAIISIPNPIGPQPRIRTLSPGLNPDCSKPCMATPKGSIAAPTSNDTFGGR